MVMADLSQTCLNERQRDVYSVPTYNPSDYYRSYTPAADYSVTAPSFSGGFPHKSNVQAGNIDARSTAQSFSTRNSAASILLDRFLSSQRTPSQQSFNSHGTPATQDQSSGAQQTAFGWDHVHFPVHEGSALGSSHVGKTQQPLPPPPSGPPPSNDRMPSRMHSVVGELAVHPASQIPDSTQFNSTALPSSFRQIAKAVAPIPLTSRDLVNGAPKIASHVVSSNAEPKVAPKLHIPRPPGRQSKPTPINIRLAERIALEQEFQPVKSAPFALQALDTSQATRTPLIARHYDQKYPQTAGLPQTWTTANARRGLPLSPIDTLLTPDSRHSLLVDFALSPSLIPFASTTVSPASNGRPTQSPSSVSWSPQTPRAMTFETGSNTTMVSSKQAIDRGSDDRRQTMIEEEVQDATPLELDLHRGRVLFKHDTRTVQDRRKARSMSPPTSAYPKDSAFNWDSSDTDFRFATDDDLYCLTPACIPQMIEERAGKQMDIASDPRQTILESYFGR